MSHTPPGDLRPTVIFRASANACERKDCFATAVLEFFGHALCQDCFLETDATTPEQLVAFLSAALPPKPEPEKEIEDEVRSEACEEPLAGDCG